MPTYVEGDHAISSDWAFHPDFIEIDDEEIDPHHFESLLIRKNYYEYRYPIYILNISLPKEKLYKILKNVEISNPVVGVKLSIRCLDLENPEDQGREYLKNEFIGIVDESYFNYIPETQWENIREGASEYEYDEGRIRIALFKKVDINAFKHGYINNVFKDFDMATLIAYSFKETTDGSLDLYLSPPDNERVYKQDLFVPMGFLQFMNYIDREFGIYDTGYNLFIDDNKAFIMNKKNDHGIKLEDDIYDEEEDDIDFKIAPTYDITYYIGAETENFPPTEYFLKDNAITNQVDLERFGNVEHFFTNVATLDLDQEPYDDIPNIKIRSNRFTKYRRKKFDTKNFVIKLNNYPFLAEPYTYAHIKGEGDEEIDGMNERYRITDWVTIISSREAHTRVNLKRLSEPE